MVGKPPQDEHEEAGANDSHGQPQGEDAPDGKMQFCGVSRPEHRRHVHEEHTQGERGPR